MSTDDKRVQDYLEQIRVRVDNWAQGKGYSPGGWAKDPAERDVVFLLNHIADLQVEAREKNAWGGRYWALLEECEASRPRTVEGDGSDLPAGPSSSTKSPPPGAQSSEADMTNKHAPHRDRAAAALKRLQDTFRGIDVIESPEPPLLEVLSYLTADKSSALDQAVAKVEDLSETPLILKGFPQDYDLALLLESLAALQAAPRKGLALAKIILVCTTWVDFLSLSDGSLDHVRECVESDPDWGGFTIMVNIAGDVASSIDDGLMAVQKQRLLTIAQYALAWLAELIEKGEA